MPSRCFMPSEKPPIRLSFTSCTPASVSTSATRLLPMPLLCATDSRCSQAVRPPCTAVAVQQRADLVERMDDPAVGASVHAGGARRGRVQAEDDAHRGALARAVRAEEPCHWPGRTVKLRSSTAVTEPKRLLTCSISIMARHPSVQRLPGDALGLAAGQQPSGAAAMSGSPISRMSTSVSGTSRTRRTGCRGPGQPGDDRAAHAEDRAEQASAAAVAAVIIRRVVVPAPAAVSVRRSAGLAADQSDGGGQHADAITMPSAVARRRTRRDRARPWSRPSPRR